MKNNTVVDKRQVRLEDVMKPGFIPFLGGRPKRETIIGKDEITNLKIELNTTRTVDEFITQL